MAVAIVFIGASVVPSCAQNKKGIINGAKAALGKKPPMTGTAPVVKPVTPRIPPTLQGASVPNFTASVNKALDNAVERVVAPQVKSATPQMPTLVPISGVSLDIYQKPDEATLPLYNWLESRLNDAKKSIIDYFGRLDSDYFVEQNGQIFINVSTLMRRGPYEKNVSVFRNVGSATQQTMRDVAAARTKQIEQAIIAAKLPVDPITLGTAEKIKALVGNLERDNPLRQAVEGMLKTAEDDGYIMPITTPAE